MNDFTKEELEELMNGLDWIIDRGQQADITFNTRIKLQSLIDNYCDTFECQYCGSLRHKEAPNNFCCGDYRYANQ